MNAVAPSTGVGLDISNLEEELELSLNAGVRLLTSSDPTPSFAPSAKSILQKPWYFNRVEMGYDWNKYDRTHYDHDNPQPKYKFNMFYPDLFEQVEDARLRAGGGGRGVEVCIPRFTAELPHEGVAFKTINRQWSRSRKRGYRSTFKRGVLTLYFNSTSYWYRR